MKNLITTAASVIVLMMFLLQFTANQLIYKKIIGTEFSIKNFIAVSEQDGCLSSKNIRKLKENISDAAGCGIGEVLFLQEEKRDGICSFEVKLPLYGIIGPEKMFGKYGVENSRVYRSVGVAVFEKRDEAGNDGYDEGAAGGMEIS